MPLAPGQSLLHYRLVEKIGEGGMGVVYRAEDLKLRRQVALKFVPEGLESGERRVRLLREARLAAALSHPNICTIHEVGEVGPDTLEAGGPVGADSLSAGTPFIAMELVRGETLSALLGKRTALPLVELLEIAAQLAEGLAEAHVRKIVHRDLKPQNTMVSPEGRVKILDFGLAALAASSGEDGESSVAETISAQRTREGRILGTIAYMSPEQAQGKTLDSRSDVFSFGTMLYEMAVGKRPFQGESTVSTLAKIIEAEPESILTARADLPPDLERIVRRCLRKRPEQRYNDTRDLAVALRDLQHESSAGRSRALVVPARGRSRARWLGGIAAGILAVALVGVAIWLWTGRDEPPALPVYRQVTFTGSASSPAISPDGRSLAYSTEAEGGGQKLLVQDLEGGQALQIAAGLEIRGTRWSPDGSHLLFTVHAEGTLVTTYLAPRLGGALRPVGPRAFFLLAWAPDGRRYAGSASGQKQIWVTDTVSNATTSFRPEGEFVWMEDLDWSPSGPWIAFATRDEEDRGTLWIIGSDGRRQTMLVGAPGRIHAPLFTARGDAIYYLADAEETRALWKIAVDPASGERRGAPKQVLSGMQDGAELSISRDGTRMLFTRVAGGENLWLVNLRHSPAGTIVEPGRLTSGTLSHQRPAFSPDGRQIAFSRGSAGRAEIFVLPTEGGPPRQLTFLGAMSTSPAWSPDGQEIAFGSL